MQLIIKHNDQNILSVIHDAISYFKFEKTHEKVC